MRGFAEAIVVKEEAMGMAVLAERRITLSESPVESETEAADVSEQVRSEELRLLEAMLFASSEPLDEKVLAERLPSGVDVREALGRLQQDYALRGVNLVRVAGKWAFRTAGDLNWLLSKDVVAPRKLSRAAIETLAIIAYHQPVTRAEIEDIRGVSMSKGTLDVLLETGWLRLRGRRKAPGRPITYGTTEAFLAHFGLDTLGDMPGVEELKGSGLLDGRLPAGFAVPVPSDDPALREDEDPLDPGDLDLALAPAASRAEADADIGPEAETRAETETSAEPESEAEKEAETKPTSED
jgi:segregation and condensation protein B